MNQSQRLIEFGRIIRKARQAKGLTQEQLAELCHYNATYISMLERGQRNPPFTTLCILARGLDIPLHKLLKDFKDK